MKKIVVVISKSLLTQGIFSYLSMHLHQCQVYALDASSVDAFEQVKNLQPDIVILETDYLWKDPRFPFISSLELFPHLTILELRPDSPEINIIQTEQRKPANLEEMVSFLNINEKTAFPNPILLQAA
jgi:DNA-binding NarL/FixJ family response regulator